MDRKVTYEFTDTLRYLPQQPEFQSGATVLETVMKENAGQENWNLETEAKSMLTRLGVTDFEQTVDHLSGGEKKRLALVSTLLSKSDILILDEPTNHLDHEMAQATERKRQSILRTELAWIRRGAQARSTKQKARIYCVF